MVTDRVDAVEKVLHGNGREGLLERVARVETRVNAILVIQVPLAVAALKLAFFP
jgi:hypothetical protein